MKRLFFSLIFIAGWSLMAQVVVRPSIDLNLISATSGVKRPIYDARLLSATSAQIAAAVTDETGTAGKLMFNILPVLDSGLIISNATPATTTNTLYNVAGSLYFNGVGLATGSSVIGTANRVPRFSGTTSLTNGIIFDDSTYVGVGVAGSTYKFRVAGTGYFSDDLYIARDQWLKSLDASGSDFNLFRRSNDDMIESGATLAISSLYQNSDMGTVWLSNIPVVSSVYGTEQSQVIGIDGNDVFKVGGYSDGAGSTYGKFAKINGGFILSPINTGTVVDSIGITKAMIESGDIRFNTAAAIDLTANPQIVDGTDGQVIKIIGLSDTNTLTLEDGNGLALAGGASFVMGAGDVICLTYVLSLDLWVECYRSNN